jgi:hypothetical protein
VTWELWVPFRVSLRGQVTFASAFSAVHYEYCWDARYFCDEPGCPAFLTPLRSDGWHREILDGWHLSPKHHFCGEHNPSRRAK